MKQKPQLNRQSSYSFASPGSHPEQAPDLLSSIEDFHLHDDVLQHSSDEEWEDDDIEVFGKSPAHKKKHFGGFGGFFRKPPEEGESSDGNEVAAPLKKPDTLSGLVWHAQIVTDSFKNAKVCDSSDQLKPRRPLPIARSSEFFPKLERVVNGTKVSYIFRGPLNDWPGLTNLRLVSITSKITSSKLGKSRIKRWWNDGEDTEPSFPSGSKRPIDMVRVTLHALPYTSIGYSPASLGHFWWLKFSPSNFNSHQPAQNLLHGISNDWSDDIKVSGAHHFSHRYAKKKETTKDKLVYHSAILLEWTHTMYCTVVEFAWLGGVGGYGGQSNWCDDKDSPEPVLMKKLHDGMIFPWIANKLGEIRMIDVNCKNVEEFKKNYLHRYEGEDKRFLDPSVCQSCNNIRLHGRSERDIAHYVSTKFKGSSCDELSPLAIALISNYSHHLFCFCRFTTIYAAISAIMR